MNNQSKKGYSAEKNIQILIYLLKAHHIRLAVVSPGTTNANFVESMQNDPFFKIFSAVDERSAAYMACGMAAESGEPIVISCTGATAARNYLSGLTEAFYRKLPIIAVNSSRSYSKIGQLVPQVIDQTVLPKDIAKVFVSLPVVKDEEDVFDCETKVNKALLAVKENGGGPAYIFLPTKFSQEFIDVLPKYRAIYRIKKQDPHPTLKGKVAVLIGTHKIWTAKELSALENFAVANDAPVFCEHISNYHGKNAIHFSIVASLEQFDNNIWKPDILIHIGENFGDYADLKIVGEKVWRVNEDGELHDTFQKLQYIFAMSESTFFEYYTLHKITKTDDYFSHFTTLLLQVSSHIPELPFSNIWLARKMAPLIPQNAAIHFAILSSLRAWNFFHLPETVSAYSNVGGFGIDGCLSSLIGASLLNNQKLFYGIIGDLAFFYDMNVLGNRHIGNNVRILLVNNGLGMEFKNYNHHGIIFGDNVDDYIAAKGHFGNKSLQLVKHYAEDLGFIHLAASNKEESEKCIAEFLNPMITDKPILLEVFTDSEEEKLALKLLEQIPLSEQNVAVCKEKKSLRFN